ALVLRDCPRERPVRRMDSQMPQTEFVRKALFGRTVEPDATYAGDLLALERILSTRAVGMAESIALSHLVSRYPRESDAIARELGTRPFIPFEDARRSEEHTSELQSRENLV